ncbi:insulinase family protein [Candidatus Methylopumilus universalis]|uniref:M16 family metallopeptidase n=1 Tax=Candidatus Methylopumilus universalis TaxID=2588536 RepID=UPI001124098F|nr:pitrilysin family protein [Candidatus Methylopumilus universalis]QDC96638.1 insulinase family protein [Candidatus Methylopumilus universalis]
MFIKLIQIIFLFVWFMQNSFAALKIDTWNTQAGTKVFFVENHDLPILDININFFAGSAQDHAGKEGLANLTRHLMNLGAGGINEEKLANQFSDIGAVIKGDVDLDRAYFKLRTLSSSSQKDKALTLFKNVIHSPDFPVPVIDREKNRFIASIKQAMTQPEAIANLAFMKSIYGEHPYAHDEAGSIETLQKLNQEDFKQFYKNYYLSSEASIVIVGDLNIDEAKKITESISQGLPQGNTKHKISPVTASNYVGVKKIQHPAKQAHILMGMPALKRGDKDYFPLYVGNYILGGGGFVSRLTEEVREKKGLVYSVYSYFMPLYAEGPLEIGLQTKKEQADEALTIVNSTIKKFIDDGPTEKELIAAKQNLVGGFPLRLDSNAKIVDYLSMIAFYNLPISYIDTYIQEINKVTTSQIKTAFKNKIDPNKLTTIIVGAE